MSTFTCPRCGGAYWHTPDVDNMRVVACSCDADGVPLSLRPGETRGAKRATPCPWIGERSECGLEVPA